MLLKNSKQDKRIRRNHGLNSTQSNKFKEVGTSPPIYDHLQSNQFIKTYEKKPRTQTAKNKLDHESMKQRLI